MQLANHHDLNPGKCSRQFKIDLLMYTFLTLFMSAMLFPLSSMQEINLEGTWGIIECVNGGPDGSGKVMEAEIKNGTAVCDFFFLKEGKFRQTSNMGTPAMSTQEGTWKLSGDKLLINLSYEGRQFDLEYTCTFKNETLELRRASPDGRFFVINSFRRK